MRGAPRLGLRLAHRANRRNICGCAVVSMRFKGSTAAEQGAAKTGI